VTPSPGPLAGLRVLDLSTLFAAPQVAALLGDLGAEVIRLELPEGDPLRRIGAQRDGRSLMWALANRNKRGIILDLDAPASQATFRRLLAAVDVVVENQPAAVLARWHCTYEELAAVAPKLVVVSVSCYGQDGPYAGRPGAGTLAEAFAGFTHMTGDADGPPVLPSLALGDAVTALSGVIGAVAACYHRDARGGPGQHVDVSMYEPILQLLAPALIAHEPGRPAPRRSGSRVPGGVPRNVYRAADGRWVVISGTTDAQVGRMLVLLERDDAEGRDRFGSSPSRLQHADELDALVAAWVAARPADRVLRLLLDQRIPAAPVNDLSAILADPHVIDRADVTAVADPQLGELMMVAPSPRFSATPGAIRSAGPRLGEHNRDVYVGLLGLAEADLEQLVADHLV
jgi:crotonobetainyl-CoA:carnitine CoA-transferase CaiB-like acyl-CoA transferase